MMRKLAFGARDRRAIGFGVAALIALLLAGRGVPALVRATRDARSEAFAALTEARDAERFVNRLRERAGNADTSTADNDGMHGAMLHAVSGAGLASALEASVEEAADSAGVRLTGLRAATVDTTGGALRRVVADATAECDVEGLATLLAVLETGRPVIRIGRLILVVADVAAPPQRPEVLRVEIQVEAIGVLAARTP